MWELYDALLAGLPRTGTVVRTTAGERWTLVETDMGGAGYAMTTEGDSIAPLAGFFKIPADHVIVLCDDITQAPGKLRIRSSGSAGGHNGLKSIIARLGGENFPRIRIGVGAKPRPDYDLADWVLGKFPPDDVKAMTDRYPDLEAAARLIMDGNLGLAQSRYNG